jgi:hypothetical protein
MQMLMNNLPIEHLDANPILEPVIDVETAFLIADGAIFAKTGKHLTTLQAAIFRGAWLSQKYEQVARENFCSDIHVKRVGAELWELLSLSLAERVSKKNFRAALERLHQLKTHNSQGAVVKAQKIAGNTIEFPSGSVPLHSALYIERIPVEARAYAEIEQPGSLIRIKAPNQMGKTSLMLRILAHAKEREMNTVSLNLQQADIQVFRSLDRFLRWFCLNITRQLQLEAKLNDYWDEDIGIKLSCTAYFQGYILTEIDSPLVLALDEVNRIFEYPEIASEFLALLRSWHEEAKVINIWQKFRLVVVHSTEVYIPLNINQSPFNIGLPIELTNFTKEQVRDLAQRHGLNWNGDSEIDRLMAMLDGHPYLVRIALYHLSLGDLSLPQILAEAPSLKGIYSNHLRRYSIALQQHPELRLGLQQVIDARESVKLQAIVVYKLESMGLVKLKSDRVTISCQLYRLYFRSQQMNHES